MTPPDSTTTAAAAPGRSTLLGSILLLCAGALAAVLIHNGPISPLAVALIAAVVAGEQLWQRREELANDGPAPPARSERFGASAIDWTLLAIVAVAFAIVAAAAALLGGASAALIGFPAGFVLRDLVLLAR